jgi:tetrahydromethanopterin S-methyltransferase subunit G
MSNADTKPTLETILERINALGEEMRAEFAAVNRRLDALDRKIGVLSKDLVDVRADLAGMDARITALESSRT